jgi:hypothetical protein
LRNTVGYKKLLLITNKFPPLVWFRQKFCIFFLDTTNKTLVVTNIAISILIKIKPKTSLIKIYLSYSRHKTKNIVNEIVLYNSIGYSL